MPGSITLLTEDAPSEIVAERLVRHVDPEAVVTNRLGRRGIGYIRTNLRNFNQAAGGMRIFVLVDRDRMENCPVELIREWLGGPQHPNLVVRFAEMETEAWIMADRDRIARFLDIPANRVPQYPDQLSDAKQSLVNLARGSRSSRIRDDMCPSEGFSTIVGPAYNQRLEEFLRTSWRVDAAAEVSPSLQRAQRRIRELCRERPSMY